MSIALAYLASALIAAVFALSELVSRYKDAPLRAARTASGLGYITFNAGIAAVAFALIYEVFPVYADETGTPNPTMPQMVTLIVLAGAGSLTIMRSSLFTARVGNQDVEIGLAGVIQIFRFAIDRNVDRVRAHERGQKVAEIMKDVSFERAYRTLTSMCLTQLQNVPAEEKALIRQQVDALASQEDRSDESKALELGLILAGTAGFEVLLAAKTNVKDDIASAETRKASVMTALDRLDYPTIRDALPLTCLGLAPTLPDTIQEMLAKQTESIDAEAGMAERAKAINIGLLLAHVVGETVFESAVDLLSHTPSGTSGQP